MTPALPPKGNRLLDALPKKDRQRLLQQCERTDLQLSMVLSKPYQPIGHVLFPMDGFVSLVVEVDGHPGLEVGMVGNEGMLGGEMLLNARTTPWRIVVQGTGHAMRLSASGFRRELQACAALQRTVHNYLAFRIAQLTVAAACERFHLIGPRLARWLLMSQDRAHSDAFHVTHEFLAFMLGVRRVGVTMAAGELARLGVIEYSRGHIKVLDRGALEAQACSCYAANQHAYDALMG